MDVGGIKLLKHAICVPGAAAPFKSHTYGTCLRYFKERMECGEH